MLIDWSRFLPALILLLIPIALFHGPRVRYRELPQDWRSYWGPTFRLGLHSIDLVRAMLGAWYLSVALAPAIGATGFAKHAPLAAHAVLLGFATLLQAVVCKESKALHAPFTFVAGLTLGFVAPVVGGFSLLIAGIVAFGTRSATAFFPILSLALVGTGFFFGNLKPPLAAGCVAGAATAPWIFALLFSRTWFVTHAQKRSTRDTHAAPDVLR